MSREALAVAGKLTANIFCVQKSGAGAGGGGLGVAPHGLAKCRRDPEHGVREVGLRPQRDAAAVRCHGDGPFACLRAATATGAVGRHCAGESGAYYSSSAEPRKKAKWANEWVGLGSSVGGGGCQTPIA